MDRHMNEQTSRKMLKNKDHGEETRERVNNDTLGLCYDQNGTYIAPMRNILDGNSAAENGFPAAVTAPMTPPPAEP